MSRKNLAILLAFVVLIQPTQLYLNGRALTTSNDNVYFSMKTIFNYWQDLKPTTTTSYYLSTNTYWSNDSVNLRGTERLALSLTDINMEVQLTSNSMFKFAWKFDSTQYDYIGFILYTPTNSYYITSYFGHTTFVNVTNSAIYEFNNEQPNTWYQHTINIGQLFLQAFGFIPAKITNINIENAYFDSAGLINSNQVSYFDDFMFYAGNSSFISEPTPITYQNTGTISNIFGNQNVLIIVGLIGLGVLGLLFIYKSKVNQKVLKDHARNMQFNPLKIDQENSKSIRTSNICVHCHSRIDATDIFCSNCGTPVISLK